jgi:hypothetical protein
VRSDQVKVEPFVWERYVCDRAQHHTAKAKESEVSKKKLKALADEMGLAYDEKMLRFGKKLINHYLKQRET